MKSIKSILLVFALIFVYGNSIAQKEYKLLTEKEGVEISYKWKHSKIMKKGSPLMLFLKIENNNDFHTRVAFTIDYFWNGIRNASSEPNDKCIKANRSAKGRIKKLTFDRAKFTDKDILSENFTLDVSDLVINNVDHCKKN